MSERILQARGLTKQFPAPDGRVLTACNGIDLDICAGQTVGIVGESGCGKIGRAHVCGKSTLARVLTRMETPDAGTVTMHGQDILSLKGETLRQSRKRMQMVFQDPLASFNPKMRVLDILTEPMMNFGLLQKRERRAKAGFAMRPPARSMFPYRQPSSSFWCACKKKNKLASFSSVMTLR